MKAQAVDAEAAIAEGVVVDRMRTSEGNFGFDAAAKQNVDLFKAGIIDPTKTEVPELGADAAKPGTE